jgi:AcrR family transcriptional regulator
VTMTSRTVLWRPDTDRGPTTEEGLRERKKRLMRGQLSSTATGMFLERGFDAVRVTEIAAACGVSEKTVFNYFPTKEALLLDRFDDTSTALIAALSDATVAPLDAALKVLDDELDGLSAWLAGQDDVAAAAATLQRFRELSTSTAGLRSYQHDMTEALTLAVAQLLAERAGLSADDPEPQIAAIALVGLWKVQGASLQRALADAQSARSADAQSARSADAQSARSADARSPGQVRELVSADVHRAAARIAPVVGAEALPTR